MPWLFGLTIILGSELGSPGDYSAGFVAPGRADAGAGATPGEHAVIQGPESLESTCFQTTKCSLKCGEAPP
jgi:hypothetical protein